MHHMIRLPMLFNTLDFCFILIREDVADSGFILEIVDEKPSARFLLDRRRSWFGS